MSKILHCAEVIPGCDYVARGESDAEMLQQAAEDARTVHNVSEVTS